MGEGEKGVAYSIFLVEPAWKTDLHLKPTIARFIMEVLSKNPDAWRLSTFLHKER
jgi:hypothetical protein